MAEINVVPYIDVMLVLLVIFMITAPLLRTGVDIDLPDAAAAPITNTGPSEDPLILTVDKDGAWYLNISDTPETQMDRVDVQSLATAALLQNPQRRVLVAGDTAVEYGDVMQAMVALQLAGAPEVGLMSEPDN
ncbi:UNVERIFIED_CONTAM: hypothetical protein GTU68_020391 [Idotea baltica]|nr:hypothetical protein [Idotea baltica]